MTEEINAHPWRNPDAHSIPELDHMYWDVEMARKGGVPADRVLNAMTLPKIQQHLKKRRRSFARGLNEAGSRRIQFRVSQAAVLAVR